MAKVKLTINDKVEIDGDLGEWTSEPPEFLSRQLKPGAKPQPYMQAILLAVTHAVMTDRSVVIDAFHRSNRWNINVQEV